MTTSQSQAIAIYAQALSAALFHADGTDATLPFGIRANHAKHVARIARELKKALKESGL